MPVSDYLLALALTLHPQGDHKLAVTVSADALDQPNGGAVLIRTIGNKKSESGTPAAAARGWPVKCPAGYTPKKDGGSITPMDVKKDGGRKITPMDPKKDGGHKLVPIKFKCVPETPKKED